MKGKVLGGEANGLSSSHKEQPPKKQTLEEDMGTGQSPSILAIAKA